MYIGKQYILPALFLAVRLSSANVIETKQADNTADDTQSSQFDFTSRSRPQEYDAVTELINNIQRVTGDNAQIGQATEQQLRVLLEHTNLIQARIGELLPGEVSNYLSPRNTDCLVDSPPATLPIADSAETLNRAPISGATDDGKQVKEAAEIGAAFIEHLGSSNEPLTTVTLTSTMRATKTVTLAYAKTVSVMEASASPVESRMPVQGIFYHFGVEEPATETEAGMEEVDDLESQGYHLEQEISEGMKPANQTKFQRPSSIEIGGGFMSVGNRSVTSMDHFASSSSTSLGSEASTRVIGGFPTSSRAMLAAKPYQPSLTGFSTIILSSQGYDGITSL